MKPEQRIHELKTRQVIYLNHVVVKLSKFKGVFFYNIYHWNKLGDSKALLARDVYSGQDPKELVDALEITI